MLPDRPPRRGLARINPFPTTQARLKRLLPKLPTPMNALVDCVDALPSQPGSYVLYDLTGEPLYIGKAHNLRRIVGKHLSPREPNPLIRSQIGSYQFFPTNTLAQAAEREGECFDIFLRLTGAYPQANRIKPPRSKITDDEIHQIRTQWIA